jgi:beta-1,4-mannosyl-glycoprotein beta-1,4-N-acetylglucosaminyltransferase
MFNDEFEMLDIRLALTQQYVDRWIILEGNRTWSGQEKSYNLSNNLDRYTQYQDRITVIKLDIPETYVNWQCENHSRSSLQQEINNLDAQDIVIHSDLDEIVNPENHQQCGELDFLLGHTSLIDNQHPFLWGFDYQNSNCCSLLALKQM